MLDPEEAEVELLAVFAFRGENVFFTRKGCEVARNCLSIQGSVTGGEFEGRIPALGRTRKRTATTQNLGGERRGTTSRTKMPLLPGPFVRCSSSATLLRALCLVLAGFTCTAGGAVAPSPSSPRPEAQCAAPGGPNPVAPNGVAGAGAFFLLDRGAVSIAGAEGGPLEGTGFGSGDSGHVSGPSCGSPQLRRPLGEPSGWRLAAD
ncbi:unnamed protein product [Pleuronectes platessa]|uniref:Uncharacterized protein n=1 Tax=Pleuronectes platessa TaxID=8262 RepID=A0A9N7TX18_PLEPL|nr:unnamed protein product [Pleuronectes platessa]